MQLAVGQRWRWIFDDSCDKSDVIIEIISVGAEQCSYTIVQVIQSNFTLDKVGREFLSERRFDLKPPPYAKYEYLEGQDKPQMNTNNVILNYPIEYISATIKI
jgi:hypothetical protein